MSRSAFDDLFDRHDDEREGWTRRQDEKTCKRCGEAGLLWANDGRAWYLTDAEGYEHECSEESLRKTVADDFDVLP